MGRLMTTLGALGLGAGLMYFMDPDQGRRRRSLVRDKVVSAKYSLNDALLTAGEDLRNRTRGMMAEGMGRLSPDEAPDAVIAERARAEMGRYVGHTGGVNIEVNQGRLTVSGPILRHEVDGLLRALGRVRGVKSVENRLDVHDTPGNIPALQGEARTRRPRPELLQEHWSPAARFLTGVGGTSMALYGLGRGGLMGMLMALGGAGLAVRGITNRPVGRLLGAGRAGVDVVKSIHVNAPVEQVYETWANFQNFPRFMVHVKEVRDLGNGRSHWTVAGPAGMPVEWDAEVTRMEPNRVIAWKSLPGQAVQSAGIVQFQRGPTGGTRVTVRMSYSPPAGAVGHTVAQLLGADPKSAMDEDLVRFKSLIETGKASAEGQAVRREGVPGEAVTTGM